MRSAVADEVRASQRRREAQLTPGARVQLALELGARDLHLYAEAHGLSRREAKRALRAASQAGRTPSAVMTDPSDSAE